MTQVTYRGAAALSSNVLPLRGKQGKEWDISKKILLPSALVIPPLVLTFTFLPGNSYIKFTTLAVVFIGAFYLFQKRCRGKEKEVIAPVILASVKSKPIEETNEAKFARAIGYFEGENRETYPLAYKIFFELDRKGYPQSNYYLGCCLRDGKGVLPNPRLAFEAFSRIVYRDDNKKEDSDYEVAWCYRDGKGTPINPKKAKDLFEHLTEGKYSAIAHYELGWFSLIDRGGFENPDHLVEEHKNLLSERGYFSGFRTAITHFDRATEGGIVEAYLELARFYRKRDPYLYKKQLSIAAAKKTNGEACYQHAMTLESPGDARTKKHYLFAAEKQGHPKASYQLYEITRNKIYLEQAAEWGFNEAQYLLALEYERRRDFPKMLHYLEMSAERGFGEAQRKLEGLYFRGEHVVQSLEKANEWKQRREDIVRFYQNYQSVHDFRVLENFALRGHPRAVFLVAHFYWLGIDVPRDQPKALEWIDRAIQLGENDAKRFLSHCYWTGQGVPIELYKAKQILNS